MNAQHKIYRSIGKVVLFISLTTLLMMGWSRAGRLALAQEPDPPIELPPPGQPDGPDSLSPPDEAELGEPVKDEAYVAADDVSEAEDGPVDIFDLAFVASRLGSTDAAADLNLDGLVNILDLAILAQSFGQAEPEAGTAAIAQPTLLPLVEAGDEFGAFELAVESDGAEVEAQCCVWRRPLLVGLGVNYVRAYDSMEHNSAPDLYAVASVGSVAARTNVFYDRYVIQPNWRLGWWRYYSFPRTSWYAPEAGYYHVPVTLEIRDYDGRICYGFWGCRDRFELADVSPPRYQRTKSLTLYPSSCKAVDETGWSKTGYWLTSHRCRINLQSWGTEWPRAYVNYYLDVQWQ
jgi:hypothetical protein